MGNFSKRINDQFSNKGPDVGFCAICRVNGALTRDHVPPKNCGNIKNAIIREVFPDNDNSYKRKVNSQGGLHFKTICSSCNNTLLGTNYDPALSRVVKEVEAYITKASESRFTLPTRQFFDYQPNKFIRSVLGHLLAANAISDVKRNDNIDAVAPLDAELRVYVLDQTRILPTNISIYYWFYPYKRRVIIKHGLMGMLGSGDPNTIYGHVFKFFPFGFWVVRDESINITSHIKLPKFNLDTSSEIEANSRLLINFSSIPKPNFPEVSTDNQIWWTIDDLSSQANDAAKKQHSTLGRTK